MTAQSTALALPEEERPLSLLLARPGVLRKFELACGQQAGSVMINIYNAAAANPEIWNCVPETVINSALDAAALKLSLASSMGFGCILPYKKWGKDAHDNWIVKETRASFVPMKRGIRELAMRTHEYRVLNSFTLKRGQTWDEDQMTGIGHIVGLAESKDAPSVSYGAYLLLFSGYEATEHMTEAEILEHCERYSPSWDKKNKDPKCTHKFVKGSKWDTDFDMMAEGVVLKRLIKNKGVMSDQDKQKLEEIDNAESGPDLENLEQYDADTVDGVVTDAPAPQPKRTETEALKDLGFDDEPKKPAPAQPEPARTRNGPTVDGEFPASIPYSEQETEDPATLRKAHAAFWHMATVAKIITPETAKKWAIGPKSTPAEIRERMQWIDAALPK